MTHGKHTESKFQRPSPQAGGKKPRPFADASGGTAERAWQRLQGPNVRNGYYLTLRRKSTLTPLICNLISSCKSRSN